MWWHSQLLPHPSSQPRDKLGTVLAAFHCPSVSLCFSNILLPLLWFLTFFLSFFLQDLSLSWLFSFTESKQWTFLIYHLALPRQPFVFRHCLTM
jgi:hypothetical protein